MQSINIGLDFGFWNRLRGSIDWYNRQSQDLLYSYTAPQPPFPYEYILVNVGTTENTGFEIALDGDIIKTKDFNWTSGINYSFGETKLKKLSNDIYKASYIELYKKPGTGTQEYFFRTEEGSKVGQFYGYEHAGIDEEGYLLVYNANGDKIRSGEAKNEDKRYIGNGTPSQFLSWNNTFTYKDFDLNIFCRGAFGFDIFNMRRYGMGLQRSGTDNVLRDAYIKDINLTQDGGGLIDSYFLEKGDYFKIENITLGYKLPLTSSRFVNSCRVFLSAKNVYTFTKYSGNDPSIVLTNGLTPGVDTSSAYPTSTQVSVGVTLSFK